MRPGGPTVIGPPGHSPAGAVKDHMQTINGVLHGIAETKRTEIRHVQSSTSN